MRRQQFAVLLLGFQAFRIRRRGHVELVLEAFLGHLKRHGAGQDLLATLARDHTPDRKAAPVPNPLNLVVNGHAVIAGAQEVGMERVWQATFHRAAGGHQRLPQNLAAKHIGKAEIFTVPLEMVVTDGGKIQQIHQFSGYFKHASSCQYR